jgi:hypothetical protein
VFSRFKSRLIASTAALAIIIAGVTGAEYSASALNPIYTVAFHDNIPGNPDVTTTQSTNASTNLTAFSTMGFSNPNYFFVDCAGTPVSGPEPMRVVVGFGAPTIP